MSEFGLIVVWSKHVQHVDRIAQVLDRQFVTIQHYDIQWSEEILYQNFYRFYGDRLSTKSIKEKADSNSSFRLIVFKDENPKYAFRPTARGIEEVNMNFFDLKKQFRKQFNTRFGIHGSNDEAETNRDLSLLLGVNLEDYKKQNSGSWSKDVIQINRDVSGTHGWDSLEQFFYCLNAVEPYLILRGYDDIARGIDAISDIDFLVANRQKFALFANAVKISKGTERTNYQIMIGDRKVDIDLMYVGDNYFDHFWQQDCLKKRELHNKGFYVMDAENYYFSLLYHALIHKIEVPSKYADFAGESLDDLRTKLYSFMHQKGYHMVEPRDITTGFNKTNGGDIKFSRVRRLRSKKGVVGAIKRLLYKLNNMAHFRRGPD